jgi:tripartite-type tricarboxylate transporter receptor subunit TctC
MSKNDVITYRVDPPSTECDARPRGESASSPKVEPRRAAAGAPPRRRRRVHRGSQVDSQSSYRPSFLPDDEVAAALASSSSKGATRHDSKGRTSNPGHHQQNQDDDKAAAGTSGAGSPQHVFGVFLQHATGTHFRFVPFRGAAPTMQDLVGGQIDLMFADQTTSLPQVRTGNIKAYAVTGNSPLAAAPDIPTVDEAGLPGFYCSVWSALFAPKGTPRDIIAKLNAAAVGALAGTAVRERLAEMGQQIVPRQEQTPEALAALQRAEIEKWWPIIRAAGIRAD